MNSKKIVISQPFFFPWVGLFEQIKLADIFVHYDDVQFSKGHLVNRVQIKTPDGTIWLTVPIVRESKTIINKTVIDYKLDWKKKHIKTLSQNYSKCTYYTDMMNMIDKVYHVDHAFISDLDIISIEQVVDYFSLGENKKFYKSSEIDIEGSSTQRVLDIVKYFECDTYITGHGALKYLDHELFEKKGIRVEYIDYKKNVYKQKFGQFTPFVSILDLIANEGKNGRRVFISKTKYWRDFISGFH